MAIDNSFMKKKIESCEQIFVLYSTFTHLPFIECDDETFDDQVYIFTDQQMLQTYAHPYSLEKILLNGVGVPQKAIPAFLRSLYLYGVNAVMFQDEGAPIRIPLDQLAVKPNMEQLTNGPVPEANPELQLTAIYFMQELMRPVQRNAEEQKALHDLEEEMAHNLLNSNLIITFDVTDVEGEWNPADPNSKVKIPLVKTKTGKTYQPVYTDLGEMKRFSAKMKPAKYKMTAVPYSKLSSFLVNQSEGFVFNPAGFNLILTSEQVKRMGERYAEDES